MGSINLETRSCKHGYVAFEFWEKLHAAISAHWSMTAASTEVLMCMWRVSEWNTNNTVDN